MESDFNQQKKCPACEKKKRHTPEEWKEYHPDAGKGYQEDIRELRKNK